MGLTAALSEFVVILLCLPVVRSENDWGVTCISSPICALKGSTVTMSCTYSYPPTIHGRHTVVENTFWFIKLPNPEPLDLRMLSEYAGRVQHRCDSNTCTLTITDLRDSDSALYKFRLITNQPGGFYTGPQGVQLSVQDLIIKKSSSRKLHCQIIPISCEHFKPNYIWYDNGKKQSKEMRSISGYSPHSYSCAVPEYEDFHSPSMCLPDRCNSVTYTEKRICAFKGSSVDISCSYESVGSIASQFWFSPNRSHQWQNPSQPEDLSKDSHFNQRVKVKTGGRTNGKSTLKITDLRVSDSAQYRFKFRAGRFEWGSDFPGTTLTVKDPDIKVEVIWSSAGLRLVCQSSCPGPHSYIWYRNNVKITEETSFSYSRHVDLEESYSCAIKGYERHRPLPVYAPKIPKVFVSPSPVLDIMEGNSVSLTCSSDANPAAKYAWFSMNNTQLNTETQLVFVPIQSSDSGGYRCTAENELGQRTSKVISINVQYPPRRPSVSVSPSGPIVEGSSVTLTCSSDANPAAHYTWYKEDQTLTPGKNSSYSWIRISAEDKGRYHCTSANQHGQMNSMFQFIDVQYPPRLPSVSVSPSGQIVQGSSVTLTCTSDANPPVTKYTWYKEDEDSPKASGQNFTIIDFKSEHSGNYYCEAQNSRGRQNSTSHLIVLTGSLKSSVTGTITTLLLAVTLLAIFVWIRRKGVFKQQPRPRETPESSTRLSTHVDDSRDDSAVAQRQPAEQHDDCHYSVIHFSKNQDYALYSNTGPAQLHRQEEEEEDEGDVVYTNVEFVSASSSPRTNHQKAAEDPFTIYSVINK
ncbi:Fc receptor-like protein 5 [Sphaeramia orbicularis]|uniref:Fc receptor-like protein 5 n=1 Tax=Sphaeramia orbicularis TaxID=375764 RepID=UPI00117EF060|nr:Fc receptor-like protein 5 [Sphaeramia orbicularis]